MCPQASIYDDTSLYGSGYSSRAVSPLNVCHKTLPKGCHHCSLALGSVSLLILCPLDRQPSEYSWYSSGASSTRSSPVVSTVTLHVS